MGHNPTFILISIASVVAIIYIVVASVSGIISPTVSAALIAVIGSAIIGQMIARIWKDREMQIELVLKELEFKNKFVREINDTVMSIMVAVMKVEEYLNIEGKNNGCDIPKDLKTDKDTQYKNFLVKSHIIQSTIQIYFTKDLSEEWNILINCVKFVKQLSEKYTSVDRKIYIDNNNLEQLELANLLVKSKDLYNDKFNSSIEICNFKNMLSRKEIGAWYEVKHAIVDTKNEIIQTIYRTDIPEFNSGGKSSTKGDAIEKDQERAIS